ncbi:MAG: energy transducer TonB [Alphaproteobacteria bacterium]
MTLAADAAFGRREPACIAQWSLCLLLALAAHAGIVLFLLSRQIEPEPPATPPPAVLIELAPLPAVAPMPAEPQPASVPDIPPTPPVPQTEAQPLPPEPEPKVLQPPPEPSPAPAVTLPTPPPKPKPTAKPRPKPPPKPRQVEPAAIPQRPVPPAPPPPRVAAPVAPVPAPPVPAPARAVAPVPSPGAIAAARHSWQSQLLGWLSRHKRYPRAAQEQRQQGTAYLRFALDRYGRVLSYRLDRSSGFAALDEEVTALIQRAQPLPPPPPELPGARFELVVPVDFSLRHYR